MFHKCFQNKALEKFFMIIGQQKWHKLCAKKEKIVDENGRNKTN